MAELLKFEYYRIFKSKVIWIMTAFAAVAPLLAVVSIQAILFLLGKEDVSVKDLDLDTSNIKYITWYIISYFYERLPLVLALFIPLFIGRDYKDGFIRNKLSAGHTRLEIFASAVITQVSLAVALCIIYILVGFVGISCTTIGSNLNHGEMLLRAGTLILSLVATTVLFTALSLLIKSRAGTTVIAIAFVFSFSLFSMLATNFSYTHKTIKDYAKVYNEKLSEYYGDAEELDEKTFFNAGWYIGHPVFVLTNASLGSEFVPNINNLTTSLTMLEDEFLSYSDKITRTPFMNSLYFLFSNNLPGSIFLDSRDISKIHGAQVKVSEAELVYNIKSIVWTGIYFGAGYALFRKKNIF
ncbi:MAG: ABC transporter permease subunit [Clostridiales bacterium]|nr:ABC transporter permease subunit [Clostridiales bacterium]